MAALTVSQCRAFLADRLAALFPDDSVYNARIRPIPSDRLPWSRVDITAGSSEEQMETLTVTIMIARRAVAADFEPGVDTDLALRDRVDADLLRLRDDLESREVVGALGEVTRLDWQYGDSDDTDALVCWAAVTMSVRRLALYLTDPGDMDDLDSCDTTLDAAGGTVKIHLEGLI